MANKKLLSILEKGVNEWNEWRIRIWKRQNPENSWQYAKDIEADFGGIVGHDIEPNLIGADFFNDDLANVNFRSAKLQEANFGHTILKGADLSHADLEDAFFADADLEGANLYASYFNGASFDGARLCNANLLEADLSETSWDEADLSGAIFKDVDLAKADLRFAKNFVLDNAFIEGTQFSTRGRDPWSILRQKYTGPMLFFHLLFLVLFFGFNFTEAVTWKGVNLIQEELILKQKQTSDKAMNYIVEKSIQFDVREECVEQFSNQIRLDVENLYKNMTPCLAKNCSEETPVWKILLKLHDSTWQSILLIILVFYNGLRAFYTYWISILRDAEERSSRSPRYTSYKYWYLVHCYFMVPVWFVAIISIAYNCYDLFVKTSVILPASL